MTEILNLREKFGAVTGLRHADISDKSGEEFYHQFLNEAFKNCFEHGNILLVDLDGNKGYSPSFIDESFGNLVYDFHLENVQKYLKIKSNDFSYWESSVNEVTFPLWEMRRKNQDQPKKTTAHEPWWRWKNSKFFDKSVWIKPIEK